MYRSQQEGSGQEESPENAKANFVENTREACVIPDLES